MALATHPPNCSDEEIIALIKSDQLEEAARCIHKRFWRSCRLKNVDPNDEEYKTAYGDAILGLIHGIQNNPSQELRSLNALFCAIFRNKVVDQIRKRPNATEPLPEYETEGYEEDLVRGSFPILNHLEFELFKRALEGLTHENSLCWHMWDARLSGYKWEEIAPSLPSDKPMNGADARKYFSRVCKKLLFKKLIEFSFANEESDCVTILLCATKLSPFPTRNKAFIEEINLRLPKCIENLEQKIGKGAMYKTLACLWA